MCDLWSCNASFIGSPHHLFRFTNGFGVQNKGILKKKIEGMKIKHLYLAFQRAKILFFKINISSRLNDKRIVEIGVWNVIYSEMR